jgi:hypothetical protein
MHNAPEEPAAPLSALTWNGFPGVLENARVELDGREAVTIVEDGASGFHRIMIDLKSDHGDQGFFVSFKLRPAGRHGFRLDIMDDTGGLGGRADATLSDRRHVIGENTSLRFALTPVFESWFQFSARVHMPAGHVRIIIALRDQHGAVIYAGDGKSGLMIEGLTLGSVPSSPAIPALSDNQVLGGTIDPASCVSAGADQLHVLLIGLPKSANVFIRERLMLSCRCDYVEVSIPGPDSQIIDARRLEEFITRRRAIAGDHIRPTRWNMDLLSCTGLDRITLLVRDPRDALVSYWHHLERPDIRDLWWVKASEIVSGARSANYSSLSPSERLDDLIERSYGGFQAWLQQWMETIESNKRFDYHIVQYETFIQDRATSLKAIAGFHGLEIEPALPAHGEVAEGGIRRTTHFRRGEAGSHRREMSARQQERVNALSNRELFAYFGWTI